MDTTLLIGANLKGKAYSIGTVSSPERYWAARRLLLDEACPLVVEISSPDNVIFVWKLNPQNLLERLEAETINLYDDYEDD